MIKRPKTAEQYVDLIDQAIFEIEELRLASEYDTDGMGGASSFMDELEQEIRALRRSMVDGEYAFGKEDLPYMGIVDKADERLLPFKYLLRMINETHTKGLDVDED